MLWQIQEASAGNNTIPELPAVRGLREEGNHMIMVMRFHGMS